MVRLLIYINFNVPVKFSLSQNYPNPVNPTTKITYHIPNSRNKNFSSALQVVLRVYDVLVKEVAILLNEK